MPTQLIHKGLLLLAALTLLAALLAGTPGRARAAGAVRCDASSPGTSRAARAQAAASHQAGLVIDFGDGRVLTFCIDLGEDGQATGEELLRASNLQVIIDYSGGLGGAVCKIDNVGSDFPAEPCFSHCTLQPGQTCMYWTYSQLVGDHWQFSQVGASSTVVHSGDVNGWAWGESTVAHGAQPPLRTLAEICLPTTATPTPSATPTASPTPSPSTTPTATQPPATIPAQGGAPPATATPYVARVITATPTASATPTRTPTASPVVAAAAPTLAPNAGQNTAPVPTALPTAPPAASPIAPRPLPTETPSATPVPPATEAAQPKVAAGLSDLAPANRGISGSLRIQIPLIQYAVAATPSATTGPTARAEAASATPRPAPAQAMATPALPRQRAPADNPTRTYPYFGGTAAFLLAGWALLRRGRGRRSP